MASTSDKPNLSVDLQSGIVRSKKSIHQSPHSFFYIFITYGKHEPPGHDLSGAGRGARVISRDMIRPLVSRHGNPLTCTGRLLKAKPLTPSWP